MPAFFSHRKTVIMLKIEPKLALCDAGKKCRISEKKSPNFENLFYVIQAMLWSEIVTEVADICNLATKKKSGA